MTGSVASGKQNIWICNVVQVIINLFAEKEDRFCNAVVTVVLIDISIQSDLDRKSCFESSWPNSRLVQAKGRF